MSIKALFVILILCIPNLTIAGESKQVANRNFEDRGGTWVEKSIPKKYKAPEALSCVHGDETWKKWRTEHQDLAEILDIGEYVSFWFPNEQSPDRVARSVMGTAEHRYAAAEMSQNGAKAPHRRRLIKMVLNKAPVSYTTWGLIGGGAVVVGALASGQSSGDNSSSPIKR